jgi:hypothetical protein
MTRIWNIAWEMIRECKSLKRLEVTCGHVVRTMGYNGTVMQSRKID